MVTKSQVVAHLADKTGIKKKVAAPAVKETKSGNSGTLQRPLDFGWAAVMTGVSHLSANKRSRENHMK
jgi:hypothetical protein